MRLLALALAAALLMAGCGDKATDIVPADAAEKILSEVGFRDTLIEAEGEVAGEWYDFDGSVTDYAVYISGSGATAEEIAVIKSSDLKTARATVDERVEDLIFRFESYVPGEMEKLNDPVIAEKGDIIILILSDDREAAHAAAAEILK